MLKDDVSVDENFGFWTFIECVQIFSLEFIVSEIDINTVQTLLKAKLGSTKEKAPKKGRTYSQLSNDSNNSIEFDLSGLDHIQK